MTYPPQHPNQPEPLPPGAVAPQPDNPFQPQYLPPDPRTGYQGPPVAYPPQYTSPQNFAYAPQKKSRRVLWVSLAIITVAVAVAVAGAWFFLLRNDDQSQIKAAVTNFVAAVDTQDQAAMLTALCSEEANEFVNDDDYDPDNNAADVDAQKKPLSISSVRVDGDVATVTVTRPPADDARTLYLRKEEGKWKVCAPAGEQPKTGK